MTSWDLKGWEEAELSMWYRSLTAAGRLEDIQQIDNSQGLLLHRGVGIRVG